MVTGAGHSTTSEKSSPYLHQGMILTHMVPDLASILRKMAESDRPDVLHPRAWALSDRPNRPPGASMAFQRLQKATCL